MREGLSALYITKASALQRWGIFFEREVRNLNQIGRKEKNRLSNGGRFFGAELLSKAPSSGKGKISYVLKQGFFWGLPYGSGPSRLAVRSALRYAPVSGRWPALPGP